MKANDLMEKGLGEFDIVLSTGDITTGIEHKTLNIVDIGYSDKVILVSSEEKKLPINLRDNVMYATIKEDVKKELGNTDGFYNGEWRVVGFDRRDEIIHLIKIRGVITRKFDEVDVYFK